MAEESSTDRGDELAFGATQIDGQPATSIVYGRSGQTTEDQRFDLSFRMGRKSVTRLKDLDSDQLREAVGKDNADRIQGAEKDKGTLSAESLSHERGQSPAAREAADTERDADESNAIERLDDREQGEEIQSAEVRKRLAGIRMRSQERRDIEQNKIGDRADEGRTDIENLEEQAFEQDAENDRAENAGGISDRSGEKQTQADKERESAMIDRLHSQFRVSGSNKYHFKEPGSRVAFKDKGQRIVSGSNDERVSRAMATMADARGWKAIRVKGHPDFRRDVWMEASLRGLEVKGYKPNERDVQELDARQESRMRNKVEQDTPAVEKSAEKSPEGRQSAFSDERGSRAAENSERAATADTGAKSSVVGKVASAVISSKFRTPQQREAVQMAMDERLAQRERENRVPSVPVYDRKAASRSDTDRTVPQVERNSERTR